MDVTQGFGAKWKAFFQELELHHDLNPDNDVHIWLLHHLFLHEINQDASDWAGAWNHHIIMPGRPARTPNDLYFFGQLEAGPRGIEDEHIAEEDLAGYGVDWDDMENEDILNHHDEANPDDAISMDDFAIPHTAPTNLSQVDVPAVPSPLTSDQEQLLYHSLAAAHLWEGRSMESYRLRWIEAFHVCRHMYIF